jgi:hypothetical protein
MSGGTSANAYRQAFVGVAEYAAAWVRKHPRASAVELARLITNQAELLNAPQRRRCVRCGQKVHKRLGEANWRHDTNDLRECTP